MLFHLKEKKWWPVMIYLQPWYCDYNCDCGCRLGPQPNLYF